MAAVWRGVRGRVNLAVRDEGLPGLGWPLCGEGERESEPHSER